MWKKRTKKRVHVADNDLKTMSDYDMLQNITDKFGYSTHMYTTPHWPWNIEDALTLLRGEDFHSCTISGFADFGWSVTLENHAEQEFIGSSPHLARAICEAWLLSKEKDEGIFMYGTQVQKSMYAVRDWLSDFDVQKYLHPLYEKYLVEAGEYGIEKN